MRIALGVVAGLVLAAVQAQQAAAEIGKASAAPGEWWLGFNIGAAATWGPEHQAYLEVTQSDPNPVDFDDGFVFGGGVELGYSLRDPALFDRVELNLDLSTLSRGESETGLNSVGLAMSDGTSGRFSSVSDPGAVDVTADEDGFDVETRVAFKRTLVEEASHTIVGSLEPFFRYQDTSSDVEAHIDIPDLVVATHARQDDVEASYFGIQAAAEFERPMSETMSLVGRASAGIYYVDSDIRSRHEVLVNQDPPDSFTVEDGADAIGGRFGGALGVKVPLFYSGASFTLVATADYLTDVATIDHIDGTTLDRTRAGFDDRFDIGGRAGLVFPLR
ncbi:hypothetical protein [Taklimakanibacter lacteus]|uniref:hypothetical protein n=1 Tax=Taklimakanibacter lacteus TaxID=2268456 RepID=UPI000E6600B5